MVSEGFFGGFGLLKEWFWSGFGVVSSCGGLMLDDCFFFFWSLLLLFPAYLEPS